MKIYLKESDMRFKDEIIKLIDYICNCSGMEYEILESDIEGNYVDGADEVLGTVILTMIDNKIEELKHPE